MYKKLEKVSEKRLPEVLDSTEFKLFLVEVGWEGLPWKFIKVLINSPYVTQEILDRIVPIFREDMIAQLEVVNIVTVVKALESKEFNILFSEDGWKAIPAQFRVKVIQLDTIPTQTKLEVIISAPFDDPFYIDDVLKSTNDPLCLLCICWPELVKAWQPWQYASLEEAWQAIDELPMVKHPQLLSDEYEISFYELRDYYTNPLFMQQERDFRLLLFKHPSPRMRGKILKVLASLNSLSVETGLKLVNDPSMIVRCYLANIFPDNFEIISHLIEDQSLNVVERTLHDLLFQAAHYIHTYNITAYNGQVLQAVLSLSKRREPQLLKNLCEYKLTYRCDFLEEVVKLPYLLCKDSLLTAEIEENRDYRSSVWKKWSDQFRNKYPEFAHFENNWDKAEYYLWDIHEHLSNNPNTPFVYLDVLAHCPVKQFRENARRNPAWLYPASWSLSTSADDLRNLSQSKDIKELIIVIKNPNVPVEVLEKAILHKNKEVRYALVEVLENLERFYQREDVDTVSILKTLADDKLACVKERVATSKLATAEILDILSHDVSVTVRRNVAANDNTRLETVYRMLEDSDKKTAGTAKYHINRRRKEELLTKLWSI